MSAIIRVRDNKGVVHNIPAIVGPKGDTGATGPKGDTYDDREVRADSSELKEDVAAITSDDTVVDGKPWTSKKTVDSLCMPLEATGNPVQVYPVEGYPLGVKVSWEPTQAGSGDPSPENIRLISGRDAISVTRCGKNLINLNPTLYFDTPGRQYKLNTHNIAPGVYKLSCYTDNKNATIYIQFVGVGGKILTFSTLHDLPSTVTLNETCVNVIIVFSSSNVSGTTCTISNIQLEMGETATPYEPYTGSKTEIALPETVFGGTLDMETGMVTETWGQIASYAGEPLPGEWISDRDVYAPDATPTTGAQVVYKLASPYTIQLDKQQVAALSGVNTLYTDAGTLTVTGREDPRHTIVTLTDRIAALESAAACV